MNEHAALAGMAFRFDPVSHPHEEATTIAYCQRQLRSWLVSIVSPHAAGLAADVSPDATDLGGILSPNRTSKIPKFALGDFIDGEAIHAVDELRLCID
jgi:hypothetical protein